MYVLIFYVNILIQVENLNLMENLAYWWICKTCIVMQKVIHLPYTHLIWRLLGGVSNVKETKDGKTLKGSKGLLNLRGF